MNDQDNTDYGDTTTVRFETKVIKPSPCDYSDAYILNRGYNSNRW